MASVGTDASPFIARLIKTFKKAHGIDVELRYVPWGLSWSMLMKAMKDRDLPDVFQLGSTWVATLAHLNVLSEVPDGLWSRPAVAPWIEATAHVGGINWAMPWTVECNLLAARQDLLASAGITPAGLADWPGFLEACRLVIAANDRPDSQPNGPNGPTGLLPVAVHCRPDPSTLHWATPWLWSGGWRFHLSDFAPSMAMLNHESAVPGLRFLSKLCRSHPALRVMANASAQRVVTDFFVEGRYAFYTGHSAYLLRGVAQNPKSTSSSRWPFAVLPLPRGPAGSITRGGGSLLAVARTSRKKGYAWELVRHLTTDPWLTEWAERSGEMPALACEYWQKSDPSGLRESLLQILCQAKTYPAHPLWRTVESVLMAGFSAMCWHFLEGHSYDDRAQEIACDVDARIHSTLQMGWGVTA